MSWTTGTQTEALSSNVAVGSAFNTFTSAQYIGSTTGAGYAPANFFLPTYGVGKSILVKAYGVLSTTGTPNFTMSVSGNTTQGTYNASAIFGTTPATAMASGASNQPWELELLISCVSTGASGTFLSDGFFKVYNGTSLIAARCSSSTANPNTAVTISTESAYYIELAGTWGASSASNSVTVYQVSVLGLN